MKKYLLILLVFLTSCSEDRWRAKNLDKNITVIISIPNGYKSNDTIMFYLDGPKYLLIEKVVK